MQIKPIDASAQIYVSSASEKYANQVREWRKHLYKLVEWSIGKELPLWNKIYIDIICRHRKSDYEIMQESINKAIEPFVRKR